VWIQHDGTEKGVVEELVALGIPRNKIVLAFHKPEMRKYTPYAVAGENRKLIKEVWCASICLVQGTVH